MALGALGTALDSSFRSAEALPVLEANLALKRRYWSHDENCILLAQSNLTSCLDGRHVPVQLSDRRLIQVVRARPAADVARLVALPP